MADDLVHLSPGSPTNHSILDSLINRHNGHRILPMDLWVNSGGTWRLIADIGLRDLRFIKSWGRTGSRGSHRGYCHGFRRSDCLDSGRDAQDSRCERVELTCAKMV